MSTSIIVVNKKIKEYLGWASNVPGGGVVMCRALKQKGMPTYHGMIGHIMKDLEKSHFQNVSHNVSTEEVWSR